MSIETMWTDHKDYLNVRIIDPAMRECFRDLSRCFTENVINAMMYRVASHLHPLFCEIFDCGSDSLRKIYRDKKQARIVAYFTLCYEFDHFESIGKASKYVPEKMYGKSPFFDQVLTWHLHRNADLATGAVALQGGNPMLFRGATELPLTIVE